MTPPDISVRFPCLSLTVLAAALAMGACTTTQQETDLSSSSGTKVAHRAPIIQKTSMQDQAPAEVAATGTDASQAGANQAGTNQAEPARIVPSTQAVVPARMSAAAQAPAAASGVAAGTALAGKEVSAGKAMDSDKQMVAGGQATTPAPFRFSRAEMEDIANPEKLSWRIFYDKPSSGPDARWFDAVKRGDLDTVKQLLAAGQNIEAKDNASLGQTALGWAAFIGYEDIVDHLIAQGADLNATDRGDVYNVLKSAVLGKNVDIVKKIHALLKDRTDLNDQTVESDGETLVMVAASNNRLEIVKYLISQGADLNLVSQQKNHSALSFACARHYPEMQQLLISHGAINHRTGKPGC
ncbi:MAG: ankyrin repeat domain-containing protein [Lautropia sp.]|nr:ankyrin repeat domain-containing protein [Lautropia sp.]